MWVGHSVGLLRIGAAWNNRRVVEFAEVIRSTAQAVAMRNRGIESHIWLYDAKWIHRIQPYEV